MPNVIKNKYLLNIITIILTIISIPIITTILEIIFKIGNIYGTIIRSYGC